MRFNGIARFIDAQWLADNPAVTDECRKLMKDNGMDRVDLELIHITFNNTDKNMIIEIKKGRNDEIRAGHLQRGSRYMMDHHFGNEGLRAYETHIGHISLEGNINDDFPWFRFMLQSYGFKVTVPPGTALMNAHQPITSMNDLPSVPRGHWKSGF